MKTLSLSWALASTGRGSRGRAAGIAAGIAVGVALLLLVIAAFNGLANRGERANWTDPAGLYLNSGEGLDGATDQAIAVPGRQMFDGHPITTLGIATDPDSSFEVPGLDAPPQPGEYAASPALARLIDEAPADQLGDRFGTPGAIISDSALASPDSLVAVIGLDEATAQRASTAMLVDGLGGYAFPSMNYLIVAIVGGIAVLFPVVVLILVVTRLGQSARADRFAALRLIGATPRQVAAAAAVETGAPALVGAMLGVGLFWALRPIAALVDVDGGTFFVSDLAVGTGVQVVIPIITVLLACGIAYVAALLGDTGPLGASRERRERRPRAWSLVPLVVGVLVVLAASPLGNAIRGAGLVTSGMQVALVMAGFVLTLVGLVVAGPYLTHALSRLGLRRAAGPAGVLALRRIAGHSRSTFRAVSGLVLALFVVSLFAAAVTTERPVTVAHADATQLVSPSALLAPIGVDPDATGPDADTALETAIADLEASGAGRPLRVGWSGEAGGLVMTAADAEALGLEVEPGPASGQVRVADGYFYASEQAVGQTPASRVEPAVSDAIANLLVLPTDGTAAGIERARTALITSDLPLITAPTTRGVPCTGLTRRTS